MLLISACVRLIVSLIVIIRNKVRVPKALLFGTLIMVAYIQLDGKELKITDISYHQPSVVNLWASSCLPCCRLMPVLEQVERRYSDVKFVSLNQRDSSETVQQFLQTEGLNLNMCC